MEGDDPEKLHARYTALKEQAEAVTAELDERVGQTETALAERNQQIADLTAQGQEHQAERDRLEQERDTLQTAHDELAAQVEDLRRHAMIVPDFKIPDFQQIVELSEAVQQQIHDTLRAVRNMKVHNLPQFPPIMFNPNIEGGIVRDPRTPENPEELDEPDEPDRDTDRSQ